MRIATIVLAILGAIFSVALGLKWRGDYNDGKAIVDASAVIASAAGAAGNETMANAALFEKLGTAAILLIVAGALGVVAAGLVAKRKELPAAGLLFVAVIAPLIYSGKTLLTTSLLAIAAILAFLASRKTTAPGS